MKRRGQSGYYVSSLSIHAFRARRNLMYLAWRRGRSACTRAHIYIPSQKYERARVQRAPGKYPVRVHRHRRVTNAIALYSFYTLKAKLRFSLRAASRPFFARDPSSEESLFLKSTTAANVGIFFSGFRARVVYITGVFKRARKLARKEMTP